MRGKVNLLENITHVPIVNGGSRTCSVVFKRGSKKYAPTRSLVTELESLFRKNLMQQMDIKHPEACNVR